MRILLGRWPVTASLEDQDRLGRGIGSVEDALTPRHLKLPHAFQPPAAQRIDPTRNAAKGIRDQVPIAPLRGLLMIAREGQPIFLDPGTYREKCELDRDFFTRRGGGKEWV